MLLECGCTMLVQQHKAEHRHTAQLSQPSRRLSTSTSPHCHAKALQNSFGPQFFCTPGPTYFMSTFCTGILLVNEYQNKSDGAGCACEQGMVGLGE